MPALTTLLPIRLEHSQRGPDPHFTLEISMRPDPIDDNTHFSTLAPASEALAPRLDLYAPIHKALRVLMSDTLQCMGRVDVTDLDDLTDALDRLDTMLVLLAAHLKHEDNFMHPAIEARLAGAAATTSADHLQHAAALSRLMAHSDALRGTSARDRAAQAHTLYTELAVFVGENLLHMAVEETSNNAQLWALYSDDELTALHERLLASVEPEVMMRLLHWMARSLNPGELAGLMSELQRKLPPQAMVAVLAQTRDSLDHRRWAELARGLGLAPVSSLQVV
jgi:hypothetical protein